MSPRFRFHPLLALLLSLGMLSPGFGCTKDGPPAASPAPAPLPPEPKPAPDPHAWRAAKPAPGPNVPPSYPAPEVRELSSGLTVQLVQRPARVVTLNAVSRVGSLMGSTEKSGVSALTVRMLTEGTRRLPGLKLAEAVEALGSELESDAGRDYTRVGLEVLKQDLDAGLGLLRQVVSEPAFDQKDFTRVRAQWIDGLKAERQDPRRLASLVALRALLGPDAGAPVRGSIPDVESLTVADLRRFHQRAFAPNNVALQIVGDVTFSELEPLLEKHFANWKGRGLPPAGELETPPPPAETEIILVDRPDAVQSAFFIVQPFPKRDAPGYEARELLTTLFGGLFTSRINQNLREKHAYTYGAGSQLIATRLFGAFVIATNVRTDVTADALRQIFLELEALTKEGMARPIEKAELERARADLTHSLGAHLEHTERVAGDLVSLFALGLPRDYFATYPKRLMDVTHSAVVEQTKLITPDRLTIVVVGDKKVVEAPLRAVVPKLRLADDALTE